MMTLISMNSPDDVSATKYVKLTSDKVGSSITYLELLKVLRY